jgi:hypothetical protein
MNHSMFCIHCGNKIQTSDKFCGKCGHKAETAEVNQEVVKVENDPVDILWKKFLTIMRAEGEEDQKNRAFLSSAMWEMFNRCTLNTFNFLLEEFPEDFNNQPYRAIESIKESLRFFVTSATQVWLAQRMLKGEIIERYEVSNDDVLAEEWKRINSNLRNEATVLPPEVETVLDAFYNQLENGIFENNPTLKDLPKVAVDKIKDALLRQLVNGYVLGLAEDSLRAENKR